MKNKLRSGKNSGTFLKSNVLHKTVRIMLNNVTKWFLHREEEAIIKLQRHSFCKFSANEAISAEAIVSERWISCKLYCVIVLFA